jgi:ATP-dependent Zn protease
LKQHIAKGDVRDVQMSATEVRALPTDSARQAGAPAMWVATPVPNDAIVPLLESKNITYQGIKSDESHIALILGIIAGLIFVVILGISYKRMNPVTSMTALTRGRLRARDRKGRPITGFDSVAGVDEAKEARGKSSSSCAARRSSRRSAPECQARLPGPPSIAQDAARCPSPAEPACLLRQRFRVHRGLRGRWRVPRAQAVRTARSEGAAIVFIDELDAIGKSRSGSQ